jgi:RNA recognition motif-containing protein
MSSTVFLGNLPAWVTADDIKSWLTAENLVADSVKVIRNPETQESKGFAFIEAPNEEEMMSVIRRFDRAPLEDRILRANQAQPPRPKGAVLRPAGAGPGPGVSAGPGPSTGPAAGFGPVTPPPGDGPLRRSRGGRKHRKPGSGGPTSAFAEELAKAL